MALSDCYPTDLVNTTDLQISRTAASDDWGDDSGSATILASGLSSIVIPSKKRFTREIDSEQDTRIADVILDPRTAPAGIQTKDRVQWTDLLGVVTDAEVQEIQPYSGIDGLESIVLKVGRI